MTTPDPSYFFEPWDARFTFELALALNPLPEILARYGVTEERFDQLKKNPTFMQQIVAHRAEIKEKGWSFREKARVMAEDLLSTAYDLIHSPATPANVKSDLIKWAAKVADLEPRPDKTTEQTFLPMIAGAILALSDKDLEARVLQLVAKREPIDVTPTIQ